MKTKTNVSRRVAGILYLVAFAAEMYILGPLLNGSTIDFFPIFFALLIIMGMGAGAVWMLCSNKFVNATAARAVTVVTALVVIRALLNYELENQFMAYCINELRPTLADNNALNYVLIIFRLMLLIVAAFFVLNGCDNSEKNAAQKIADGMAEPFADAEEAFRGNAEVMEAHLENVVDSMVEVLDVEEEGDIVTEKDKSLPGNDR